MKAEKCEERPDPLLIRLASLKGCLKASLTIPVSPLKE
jgi:hypothetical protein